jgi:tRNA pseudouridine synthase 10
VDEGSEKRFLLCDFCRERQERSDGDFDILLAIDEKRCFICEGVTADLGAIIHKIVTRLSRFEFQTFSVGLTLPRGMQEREDTLRSELKIRGGETIKSGLAGRIAREVIEETRGRSARKAKKVDRLHPDVNVLVDVGNEMVEVTSKPLFLYGRYTKPRGVAQRVLFCEECNGRGCERCRGTGYSSSPSVEGIVSKRLGALLGSKKFKFTWFGSEDPDSIVYPPGRPMVVELKNPLRRHPPKKELRLRSGKGGVSVSGIRILNKKFEHPAFTFMTRVVIRAERRVAGKDVLALQRMMRNALVQYRNNKGRLVDKKIYFVKASARGKKITADVKLDGGLPVKRLVSGEDVSPSFAESMKMPLRCERFDIIRVWPKP